MRLQHLEFDAYGPPSRRVALDLSAGLTVVDAQTRSTCKTICDLVGHVLYGARQDDAHTVASTIEGWIDVASPAGHVRLERHSSHVDRGNFTEPRLTVAPLNGQPVGPDTARELLGGMTPEVASRLMVLSSTDDSQLEWLLSADLATELRRLEQAAGPSATVPRGEAASDELFAERDRLSHQLELMLADKRHSSEAFENTITELASEIDSADRHLTERRHELDRVLAESAELETQLRYHELSEFVGRTTDEAYLAEQQPKLNGLDEQIAKWRRALAELEAREADIRGQLAQLHPDDSSPWLPLADQRGCVSIAQRLVADLDSEVARYARPGDSTACLCRHTHARLHPLIDTLGQQVEKLARLVDQYEAAIQVEQLKAEAQHLARSQVELRATIDHLLERRQSRLRTSRARDLETDRANLPAGSQARRGELERMRDELSFTIADHQRCLDELSARREALSEQRAEIMNDQVLAALRQQLDEVTRQIERRQPVVSQRAYSTAPWRASDILAKLTDGRLREVRLTDHGRGAAAVNRQGNLVDQDDLNSVDRKLLAVSLQLAAVAGAATWGLELPVLVADPFAQLPAAESSILALVLHDLARTGQQIVIVTAAQSVLDRLRAVGQSITSTDVDQSAVQVEQVEPSTNIALHNAEQFALTLDDPIERFRVFGDDTAHIFSKVDIHTIGQLLDVDPDDLSAALDRTGVSSSIVDLWQTHVVILVYVPNLTLDDVQLLTGAGVRGAGALAEADADKLFQRIEEYLDSPRGVRHRAAGAGLTRARVANWIADAHREQPRWRVSKYAARWKSRPQRRRSPKDQRNGRSAKPSASNGKKRTKRPLRFRLSRSSPVVDAPSVGPKTSKRLAKAGIQTVADLLAADAAATADELGVKHVSAETIVAWQHQAQLMCRVPELLARDTQVLVGCGFTTPEDIAATDAADLLEFAKSYTSTVEGTRVLRGADPPDLPRVTKWIQWAGHCRALEAA